MIRTILLIATFLFLSTSAFCVDINIMTEAFRTADTKTIVSNLNTQTKVTVIDQENMYSKVQAQGVLKHFFQKYKPLKYENVHQGEKEDITFVIGNLEAEKENFRVFYLVKNNKIQQLRIEIN